MLGNSAVVWELTNSSREVSGKIFFSGKLLTSNFDLKNCLLDYCRLLRVPYLEHFGAYRQTFV